MLRKLMLITAIVLYVTPTPLVAQMVDTLIQMDSMPADSTTDNAGNPLDWGKAELLKWAIPLIGSFLVKQWNKVNGFLHEWANPLKIAFYIVIVSAMMMLGEFLHVSVSKDTADWGGAFFESLAAGGLGSILTWIGIQTAREKPVVARART